MDGRPAKSLAVRGKYADRHDDLDAMFASNESSAVGRGAGIKGRKSKVKLVGFDWTRACWMTFSRA